MQTTLYLKSYSISLVKSSLIFKTQSLKAKFHLIFWVLSVILGTCGGCPRTHNSLLCFYVFPWLFLFFSMFSRESSSVFSTCFRNSKFLFYYDWVVFPYTFIYLLIIYILQSFSLSRHPCFGIQYLVIFSDLSLPALKNKKRKQSAVCDSIH